MAEKAAIEELISAAYDARHRGDLDAVMGFFHPNCSYRMAGTGDVGPVSVEPDGLDAVREQMAGFIATFRFDNIEKLATIVDGDKATLHWRADVTFLPTGRTAPFEVMDLFTFADGKVLSLTQFTDTAGVARLMGA